MGVSRSASTVIAYAMKEFGWTLEKAYNYVKQKRSITRPNAGFMRQLSEYEGILDARWVSMYVPGRTDRPSWALGALLPSCAHVQSRVGFHSQKSCLGVVGVEGSPSEQNSYCLGFD